MIRSHLHFAWYLIRHKWFVFQACREYGIPWLGLIHDLSKFRPSEWFPYVAYFSPYQKTTPEIKAAFKFAWHLHQKRNKHHWQWWVELDIPMPDKYRLEMQADWVGAGRAMGKPDIREWFEANVHRIILHPITLQIVRKSLNL